MPAHRAYLTTPIPERRTITIMFDKRNLSAAESTKKTKTRRVTALGIHASNDATRPDIYSPKLPFSPFSNRHRYTAVPAESHRRDSSRPVIESPTLPPFKHLPAESDRSARPKSRRFTSRLGLSNTNASDPSAPLNASPTVVANGAGRDVELPESQRKATLPLSAKSVEQWPGAY